MCPGKTAKVFGCTSLRQETGLILLPKSKEMQDWHARIGRCRLGCLEVFAESQRCTLEGREFGEDDVDWNWFASASEECRAHLNSSMSNRAMVSRSAMANRALVPPTSATNSLDPETGSASGIGDGSLAANQDSAARFGSAQSITRNLRLRQVSAFLAPTQSASEREPNLFFWLLRSTRSISETAYPNTGAPEWVCSAKT